MKISDSLTTLKVRQKLYPGVIAILFFFSLLIQSCSPSIVQSPPINQTLEPTVTQVKLDQLAISFDPSVPQSLSQTLDSNSPLKIVGFESGEDLQIIPDQEGGNIEWIFTLVAPFPTLTDNVSLKLLQNFWAGTVDSIAGSEKIVLSEETLRAIQAILGKPDQDHFAVVDRENILLQSWEEKNVLAIVPFEELVPQWKVMRIDGMSPLDKKLDTRVYPLLVKYALRGDQDILQALAEAQVDSAGWIPLTNRDPNKMTILIMTGTTALVRNIAAKMEEKGITYPAEKIMQVFENADIIHISNEVSFNEDCTSPDREGVRFCSAPAYIELLQSIGTDIIELTGNHLLDYGAEPFTYTLDLYDSLGMKYYGGGENLDSARQPLLIEDHNNKIAFIGCNIAGPVSHFATNKKPGAATCDFEWLDDQIGALKSSGYITIMTFQHNETYKILPPREQKNDFKKIALAGADIVSGSQAHFPQSIAFVGNSFIHYGLGNLFFDQMDEPVKGTRQEFIDKHVFYDGRYISTELLTTMLEDYSQPRPMTADEREQLLFTIYKYIVWS